MSKEIMQQALDALKWNTAHRDDDNAKRHAAIEALEAELAKPQNEFNPDWDTLQPFHDRIAELEAQLSKPDHPLDKKADNARELGLDYEPEQKPVAWLYNGHLHECDPSDWAEEEVTPLYKTPPKREWQELTPDDVMECFIAVPDDVQGDDVPLFFAYAVESKLREKNANN